MAQIIWDGNKNWENVWDGNQPWDREIEEKSIPENAVLPTNISSVTMMAMFTQMD